MVLSDVEETVTIVEVDEENEDEAVRVRSLVSLRFQFFMYGLGASLMVDCQETIGYVVCTRRFRDHVESGRWRQNIAMAILAIRLATVPGYS